MVDVTDGKLDEALTFAKERSDESLQKCIDRLKSSEGEKTVVRLYPDFAKYSFYFVREYEEKFSGNGGVIFHGKHDNGGDGGFPTLSVNLTPVNGWSIHT